MKKQPYDCITRLISIVSLPRTQGNHQDQAAKKIKTKFLKTSL